MNFGFIIEQGDPILLAVFILLISMSLRSWYIIFKKIAVIRRERKAIELASASNRSPDDLAADCLVRKLTDNIELLKSFNKKGLNSEQVEKLFSINLSHRLDSIRSELDSGLTVLASIGSSAPFIGLFGTVWGIYNALTRIAEEGNASLNVVAGPMGEALIATAVGLFAAIPAVLAYNGFLKQNRLLVQNIRHVMEQSMLQMLLGNTEGKGNK